MSTESIIESIIEENVMTVVKCERCKLVGKTHGKPLLNPILTIYCRNCYQEMGEEKEKLYKFISKCNRTISLLEKECQEKCQKLEADKLQRAEKLNEIICLRGNSEPFMRF